MGFPINDEVVQEYALYKKNILNKENDKYIEILNTENNEMLIFWKLVLVFIYYLIINIKMK